MYLTAKLSRNALLTLMNARERTVVFDGKDYFIDEAIILTSNTHVIVDGCKIKQNDKVFDNIFRGENVIINPDDPYGYTAGDIHDIKIDGIQASQAKCALELRADVRNLEVHKISHTNKEKDTLKVFPPKYPFTLGRSSSSISNDKLNDDYFKAYRDAGVLHMELSPAECEEVYNRLVFDKKFPLTVQFDWSLLDE